MHDTYGGPEGYQRLVDACHARGVAVVLDVVYNHLGPAGNYLERFGPYFTRRYCTPWGPAVNLDDAGSHEVRRFLVDNALGWLRDFKSDGQRYAVRHTPHLYSHWHAACASVGLVIERVREEGTLEKSRRHSF